MSTTRETKTGTTGDEYKRINILYTPLEHKRFKTVAVGDGQSMSKIVKRLIEHYMGLSKDDRSKLVGGK